MPAERPPVPCQLCSRQFARSDTLRNHLVSQHHHHFKAGGWIQYDPTLHRYIHVTTKPSNRPVNQPEINRVDLNQPLATSQSQQARHSISESHQQQTAPQPNEKANNETLHPSTNGPNTNSILQSAPSSESVGQSSLVQGSVFSIVPQSSRGTYSSSINQSSEHVPVDIFDTYGHSFSRPLTQSSNQPIDQPMEPFPHNQLTDPSMSLTHQLSDQQSGQYSRQLYNLSPASTYPTDISQSYNTSQSLGHRSMQSILSIFQPIEQQSTHSFQESIQHPIHQQSTQPFTHSVFLIDSPSTQYPQFSSPNLAIDHQHPMHATASPQMSNPPALATVFQSINRSGSPSHFGDIYSYLPRQSFDPTPFQVVGGSTNHLSDPSSGYHPTTPPTEYLQASQLYGSQPTQLQATNQSLPLDAYQSFATRSTQGTLGPSGQQPIQPADHRREQLLNQSITDSVDPSLNEPSDLSVQTEVNQEIQSGAISSSANGHLHDQQIHPTIRTGFPCSNPDCQTPDLIEWRFQCVTCSAIRPVQRRGQSIHSPNSEPSRQPITYSLCRQCFFRHISPPSSNRPTTDSRAENQLHDRTHQWTSIFNRGPANYLMEHSINTLPSNLADFCYQPRYNNVSFPGNAVDTAHTQSVPHMSSSQMRPDLHQLQSSSLPSIQCAPIIRLMFSVGLRIHAIGGSLNLDAWKFTQTLVINQSIDLSLLENINPILLVDRSSPVTSQQLNLSFNQFPHVMLLYWMRCNLFENDSFIARQWLSMTNLQSMRQSTHERSSAHYMFLYMQRSILQKQGVKISLHRFDFDFASDLMAAIGTIRPYFLHKSFDTLFNALVDTRQTQHRYFQQLDDMIAYTIDQHPESLTSKFLHVFAIAGLPHTATEDDRKDATGKGILRYLTELYHITTELRRVLIWRSCRLRLFELCLDVMKYMLPQGGGRAVPSSEFDDASLPETFHALAAEDQQIFLFCKEAQFQLRPREVNSMFENDEEFVVECFVDQGMGCAKRIQQLAAFLLRESSRNQPGISSHTPTKDKLSDSLIQLLTLFFFVARERHEDEIDQAMSVLMQDFADTTTLSLVLTSHQRWSPSAATCGDLVFVLSGAGRLAAPAHLVNSNTHTVLDSILRPKFSMTESRMSLVTDSWVGLVMDHESRKRRKKRGRRSSVDHNNQN